MASRYVADIEEAINLFRLAEHHDDDGDDSEDETGPRKTSVQSMEQITRTLREAYAEGLGEEDMSILLDRACDAEDEVLNWAYGSESSDGGSFDFFPIYSGNLIKDTSLNGVFSNASGDEMLKSFLEIFFKDAPDEVAAKVVAARQMMNSKPDEEKSARYDHALTPGKQSSPLAIFRVKPQPLTNADPATLALREARCEIQSKRTNNPVQMAIGPDVVVVQGVGGYKERDPTLNLYKRGATRDQWVRSTVSSVDQGHTDIPYYLAIDGSRRLVWTADDDRIKSSTYRFDDMKLLSGAEHTLDSGAYDGPIALIDNGARLLRVGKSGYGVWDVDSAPTHATGKGGFVGEKLPRSAFEDTWRDSEARIEQSEGSPSDARVEFDEPVKKYGVTIWASHPSQSSKAMLCASGKDNYGVFTLDLETGKRASRYFGHGAFASGFSTTPTDNNIFLTSCNDGGTRLYDVRCAVPSVTLFSGAEKVNSSVLLASGGGLYAFAGGLSSEQIKLWDIRAQSAVYELATGNNAVRSLAWDELNHTLYACTECSAMDRMGYRHDYRRANFKKPKESRQSEVADEDEDMGEDEEDEEEDEEDMDEDEYYGYGGKAWPKKANHDETSFGVAFDAGYHRLFRYMFKADADVTILPAYGDARAGEADRRYGY